ncbi:MAG: ABC transporter substrate-binding protein [Nitriliruptorales bacterium]
MTRRVAALVLALVFVSGLAPGASAQPAEPSHVRGALPGFENNLTPFTITFGSLPYTHDFLMLVYDTLFWSQVKEDPEPWLAEAATPSEDFRTWTVTLREGVVWHDGRPLTAEDVKFSFDYYLRAPGASGRYAHHVSDVPPFDRAEVVDPRTVRLLFRAPAPQFKIMPGGDLPIIPKHVWETVTEPTKASADLPVGSGPFKVVEIVPDQRYRLQANEAYFKGKPTVDELELPIVKDPAAAFAALRTGEVDFVARNVPAELGEEFASNPDLRVVKGTKFESTQLYFNARKPPLTDPRLRKAISLAIDSQALVDTVILGRGRPGVDSFIHPDSPWALPAASHEHDQVAAAGLLDGAGFSARDADGVRKAPDGSRLEFRVLVSSFEPQDIRAVQLIAQQVAPIGVRLVPEVLDPATLRERRRAPEGQVPTYDAYVSTLEAHAHVDPDGLYYFFHSPGPKGFGATITGYGNPTFDTLVERASAAGSAERRPLLEEAQRILASETPVVVFWYRDGEYAYRPAAYDGWLSDFGHGIFTKRSFLPDYATQSGRAGEGAPSGDTGTGSVWVWAVVAVVGLAVVAVFALRRRRGAEFET